MRSITPTMRSLTSMLCASLLLQLIPLGGARAEVVGTDRVIAADRAESEPQAAESQRAREEVRADLVRLGVDPDEARERVAWAGDVEVGEIRGRIDEVPAGRGFVAAVGGVLIVTVAVLFATDLFGYTDVFPFVTPLPRGRTAPAEGPSEEGPESF